MPQQQYGSSMSDIPIPDDGPPILPESVPVTMPDLPKQLPINTAHQFKAIGDPMRTRILGIVQHQPATAKQIAERLGATPGAIGHHLHVLEEAGLVQVVERRLIRGIVASYYTRTARLFAYDLPPEVTGTGTVELDFFNRARDEFLGVMYDDNCQSSVGFPHARLSPERTRHYGTLLKELVNDMLAEPLDPEGDVFGIFFAMFRSPSYVQKAPDVSDIAQSKSDME
jgi:DNA-binding transcriptional ArsR family regulator